jgi:tRNA G10  N-methylase Trm11
MDYLIRFSQSHETFRLPEIQALALIEGIDLKVVSYSLEVSPHNQGDMNWNCSSLNPLAYPAP